MPYLPVVLLLLALALAAAGLLRLRRGARALALAAAVVAGGAGGWLLLRPAGPAGVETAGAPPAASAPAASAAHPLSNAQLERAVEQARATVEREPGNVGSWAMLAHSLEMLGRYADAGVAYQRLIALAPNDAQVLADAADAIALGQGRRFDGEPARLIRRALEIAPQHPKALSLAGAEALARNDPAAALAFWQKARAQVHDPALARELDERIADARARQDGTRQEAPVAAAPAASGPAAVVSGRITLSDALKARVAPTDTLFVFARPADGSRMPVALMKRQASELPIEFSLDDSMAMVPQARLSMQTRVIVGARISRRGDALPQSGDLQGLSAPVAVGTQGLRLEIAEVLP